MIQQGFGGNKHKNGQLQSGYSPENQMFIYIYICFQQVSLQNPMVSTHPQPFAIAIACVIRVSKVWKTLWGHKCSGFLDDRLWSGHFHVDPWSSMIYQFPVGDFFQMQTGRPTMRKLRVRCGFKIHINGRPALRIQWFPWKAVGNPPVGNPRCAASSSCREHPGWLKGLKIVKQKHGNMAPFWCVSTWTQKWTEPFLGVIPTRWSPTAESVENTRWNSLVIPSI